MKAETFFHLITRGRNSGLPRSGELWFVELEGTFYLLVESADGADSVKNIAADPEVSFSIGNRKNRYSEAAHTTGMARIVDEASEPDLCARIRSALYAKYRWNSGRIIEVAPRPVAACSSCS
jgi:F420H(2)-dependent quinone reductase